MAFVSNLLRWLSGGLGAYAYARQKVELTLLTRIQWLVRARWIGVAGFISISVLLRLLGPYPFVLLLGASLFAATYNGLAAVYVQLYRKRGGPLLWPGELRLVFHVPQLLDLFTAAVLIHLTGGVESFVLPVYLVYIPTGALILSPAMAYAHTTAVVVILAALAGLEYVGVLSHHYVYGGTSPGLYRRASFVLPVLGLQAFFLYYVTYVATLIVSRMRTQAKHPRRVARVSQRISSILAPERLLQETVDSIAETFGYHYVGVYLLDQVAGELVLQAEFGRASSVEGGEYRQALDEGMMGWTARHGQLLLANDVREEPRYLDYQPHISSELDVPLDYSGRVLGVLSVQSAHLNAFGQEDVNTVQALADHIAVAIRNAELYGEQQEAEEALRRQTEELAARNAIARAVSRSLEIDEILERLYEEIDQLLRPDTVFIALYDEDEEQFEVALTVEDGERLPSFTANLEEAGGLTAWVIQKCHPLLVYDLLDETEELPVKPRHMTRPARSWLAVPLVARNRVVGVLSVQSFQPGVFTKDDQDFLSAVADQAAIAIENARLFERTQQHSERLAETLAASESLHRGLHLEEVLEAIANGAVRLGFRRAVVNVRSPEEDLVKVGAVAGVTGAERQKMMQATYPWSKFQDLMQERLRISRSYLIQHRKVDWKGKFEGLVNIFNRDHPGSGRWHPEDALLIPLRGTGDRPLVLLSVDEPQDGRLPDLDTIRTVEAFAQQGAVAIENARLFEAEQRARGQAETLQDVAAALSSTLEAGELIERVLAELQKVVPYDSASVQILRSDHLELIAGRGFTDGGQVIGLTFPLEGHNPNRAVIAEKRPVVVPDTHATYPTFKEAPHAHIRSWLGAPLIVRGEVIGMITLDRMEVNAFSEDEVDLALAFANHVAVALENARLYEEARQQAITDGLTGLYNLRYFYRTLEEELERSRRYGHDCSLIMLDLDEFKKYNDRYGHLAGDDLLKELAGLISEVIRAADVPARYGGEEFVIILPETGVKEALNVAKRLRQTVESHEFELGEEGRGGYITLSAGVATYPQDDGDVEGLVNAADMALLQAKKQKNRVSAAV